MRQRSGVSKPPAREWISNRPKSTIKSLSALVGSVVGHGSETRRWVMASVRANKKISDTPIRRRTKRE
jgi:hypothetical protein